MTPKRRRKAVVRKVTRQPRRDAWVMVDIASRWKDIIPSQSRKQVLKMQREGRDCVLFWDPKVEEIAKKTAWADPRWEIWCRKK